MLFLQYTLGVLPFERGIFLKHRTTTIKHRGLSLLLALAIIFQGAPVLAFAAEDEDETSTISSVEEGVSNDADNTSTQDAASDDANTTTEEEITSSDKDKDITQEDTSNTEEKTSEDTTSTEENATLGTSETSSNDTAQSDNTENTENIAQQTLGLTREVEVSTVVALQIGDNDTVEYATFAEAVTAMDDTSGVAKVLTLLDNVTLDEQISITTDDLTIDLAGHTLTSNCGVTANQAAIELKISKALTLTDSSEEKTGKIVFTAGYMTITRDSTGNTPTVELKDLQVQFDGGANYGFSFSYVNATILNSSITGSATSQMLNASNSANITIKDSNFTNESDGASTICATASTTSISIYSGEYVSNGGNALYIKYASKVYIYGGTFKGKAAVANGSNSKAAVVIYDGTFNGTVSGSTNSTVVIQGGAFSNTAFGANVSTENTISATKDDGYTYYTYAATYTATPVLEGDTTNLIISPSEEQTIYADSTQEYTISLPEAGYTAKAKVTTDADSADNDITWDDTGLVGTITVSNVNADYTLTVTVTKPDTTESLVQLTNEDGKDKKYGTFSDAMANIEVGDSLVLLGDVTLYSDIYTNTSFTLDLNSHTLSLSGAMLRVQSGTLTLLDGSDDGTGCIESKITTVRVEGDSTSFVMKSGTIQNSAGNSISVQNTTATAYIEGGSIINTSTSPCIYVTRGSVSITGGTIDAAGSALYVATTCGKTTIGGDAVLISTYQNWGTVYISTNGSTSDILEINDTAQIINNSMGPALKFEQASGVTNINGGTLKSAGDSAIFTQGSAGSLDINIKEEAILDGATYIISSEIHNSNYNHANVIINGGKFKFGAPDYLPFSYSAAVTYPEGKILSSEADRDGYYYLEEKGSLVTSELERTIDAYEAIYKTENKEETYPSEQWDVFVAAYEAAFAALSNESANQYEIDFLDDKLQEAYAELEASVNLDVTKLADGTYEVEVNMYKSTFTDLSMADGAIEHTAILTVDSSKVSSDNPGATLSVDFKPLYMTDSQYGHLKTLYIYDGDSPETAAASKDYQDISVRGSYSNWYNDLGDGVKVYADDGQFPGTANIALPYLNNKGSYNRLYLRVAVDAMDDIGVGEQDVILYIKYSTLTAIDVKDTLTVDTSNVVLLENNESCNTQTITPTVVGSTGYSYTYASSDQSIATVSADGKITAVKTGTATITVTASKAGNTLTKTITVSVKNGTPVQASVSGKTIQVTGDTLVTAGAENVAASGSSATIDATANQTGSAVVSFEASALVALSGSTVTLKTDVATFTYSAAAMQQISAENKAATLTITETDIPQEWTGDFLATYSITLQDASGNDIEFSNGTITVKIDGNTTAKYAYCYEGSLLKEMLPLAVGSSYVSFATTHFSNWALSQNEYELTGSGTSESGKGTSSTGFFLDDGRYYVDLALWKATTDEASMGNVAFKNNPQALVTVSGGRITTVQIGTNPVDVGGYHSAIIEFNVTNSVVNILETESITTTYNSKEISTYEYIKALSFTMPDEGQPSKSSQITYAPVTFKVPDTPMDAAVGEVLEARLRFQWSTAEETTDTTINANSKTASSTSSITGEDVKDLVLTDTETGIKLTTDTSYVSDTATLHVEILTSGNDYTLAETALKDLGAEFALYHIYLMQSDEEVEPQGVVTLSIPCTEDGLLIYRINADGSKTLLQGTIENGYYVISTSALGLFAIIGEVAEAPILEEDARPSYFTDVKGHWAEDSINYVYESGLFVGAADGTFNPDGSMSRAMFITVLGRLHGVSESYSGKVSFNDISESAYYAPYVAWAAESNIVQGTSDASFSPNSAISREEMATMLYRYVTFAGIKLNADESIVSLSFSDQTQISDWARTAVYHLSSANMINGMPNGEFAPSKTATRAEVASLMARYLQTSNAD